MGLQRGSEGEIMPRVSTNSVILVDGSTMLLPAVVRVFPRRDGYVLCYGRARRIRTARVPRYPNRHEVARALLILDFERPRETRGFATVSTPPALGRFDPRDRCPML